MQVTVTSSDGLKRTLQVVVDADELNDRFSQRLDEIKGEVQLKGFRRGKVPVGHLRKVYGRSVMAEILEKAVAESSEKALSERNERPAMQPEIALVEDEAEIEKVIAGEADLAYTMKFEVLPDIEITDFSAMKLERLRADVDDSALDDALAELAERSKGFEVEEARTSENGDRLTIDFTGSIDGEVFEGGTGEGAFVVLGEGGFIPGFAEGLEGAKAGEEKQITATFPDTYQQKDLAGKEATFAVTVKEVAKPTLPDIDDEFAKALGAEDLVKLKEMVTEQLEREYGEVSRAKLKRQLLDALNDAHAFALPPTLVNQEFDGVWKQVTDGLEQASRTFEDEGKTEEGAREEYRTLAERRVRLGLVLAEIGDKNKINVSEEELRRSLMEQARNYPGQEKMIYEFYEKNPQAVNELRAPIFEEKVVDFIVELAQVDDTTVSREVLFETDQDDEADSATSQETPPAEPAA